MKRKLTLKETVLVASTLFGMFFGAGNMIFPVHMGQLAGSNILPAILGFIITGVSIPILAVAAIGNTHSDGLQSLANKVDKRYSIVFTCLLYLTIGPFFAIPRCATVSYSTGLANLLPASFPSWASLLLFSAVFFAFVLFFSLRPSGIMTWIGKIINPTFLVFLIILIIAAFANAKVGVSQIAAVDEYATKPFFQGFLEGYNTMDAIAGLAFGIIVVNIIRGLGVENHDDIALCTVKSGIFTALFMALIYILTTVMGALSMGDLEVSENGGVALGQISGLYLGTFGKIVLTVAITFACLKTAIGLVTSCSETFEKMFPGKLSYRQWVLVFTLFSFGISNIGLSAIINYSIPVLMLLYPLAIALIILALCNNLFHGARSVYVGTIAGTLFAAIFDFLKTLPFGWDMSFAKYFLPLFDLGLGWLAPAALGCIIGLVYDKLHNKNEVSA